jgi:hypothetical protein
MEAIANQAAREGAQVLVNSGKFVAGRIIDEAGSVDEEANALAERYFDRARRLDPTLTLDPQREVRVITAQKKIQWAKDFERIKSAPSLAVRIYGEVQKEFPDLITATLWNSLCWQGSLFAATGPDSRRRAEAVSGACDEAVKHDPKNYLFVDSRGLNRLLVGKLGEAKTDFLAYAVSDRPEIRRNLRSRWIAALDARPDQNPMTAEDVAQLRLWSNLPDK